MKTRAMLTAILLLCVSMAFAGGSGIGLKAIGPEAGFVSIESSIGSTIGFGAAADLGWLTPQIALGAEVMFWSKSIAENAYEDFSYSQIYLNAIARYFFAQKKGSSFQPYAGGGLGLVIAKSKFEYKGEYSDFYHAANYDNSATGIGIVLVGGAKMALSPSMDGFGEVRYGTGEGADYFGIFAGVLFKLK
jgi:hypothetical protein